MDQSARRGHFRQHDAHRRRGEIDEDVRAFERRTGVAADGDIERPRAREFTRIAADGGRIRTVEGRVKDEARRCGDGPDVGLPHLAAGTGDGYAKSGHDAPLARVDVRIAPSRKGVALHFGKNGAGREGRIGRGRDRPADDEMGGTGGKRLGRTLHALLVADGTA